MMKFIKLSERKPSPRRHVLVILNKGVIGNRKYDLDYTSEDKDGCFTNYYEHNIESWVYITEE